MNYRSSVRLEASRREVVESKGGGVEVEVKLGEVEAREGDCQNNSAKASELGTAHVTCWKRR